jgi:CDP-diacylglycerol--serine O-phosphatidyltransferase
MGSFNRRKAKGKLASFLNKPRGVRQSLQHSEPDAGQPPRLSLRRRSIYLLPNAFTTAALFCGFYAIVTAMNVNFYHASIAIFAAMVLDAVDGRVARLTNTQSEFGAQYDSLSDMVSFGVAPALVIYEWSLRGMNKMGWLAAFVYCAGAAMRLARFNTNIAVVDKRYFQGLPSPAAAALVAGFVWLMDDLHYAGTEIISAVMPWLTLSRVSWGITVFAGLTMVTNVPFYSFKDVNFRKPVPFIAIFLIVLAFVAISSDPPSVLFGLFVCYGLSGYCVYFWRLFKGKPVSIIQTETESGDEKERR